MNEYQEKLKSLSFGTRIGRSEQRVITDDRDGSVAGTVVERWDGSQEGNARPKSIRVKAKLLAEEE